MADKLMEGIKVIELGEFITAAFCAKQLANYGAEVIKVEKPGCGDKSRSHGPFPKDIPHLEKSGLFLANNTDKMSVTLDITKPKGREILRHLLKDADILVENNPPSYMKKLGLDYASLKDEFPELIMVSITPYGQTGPYSDYKGNDFTASALNGFMNSAGNIEREPLGRPMSFMDYAIAMVGATAASIALIGRDKTGKGCQCDVAQAQIISCFMQGGIELWRLNKTEGIRTGIHVSNYFYPCCILPCKDGHFTMFTFMFDHLKRFIVEVLGNPEWWAKDERFQLKPEQEPMGCFLMGPYMDELDARLIGELEKYNKADLAKACFEKKLPFVPVHNVEDMVEHPQIKFRNEVITMDHPVAGRLLYAAAPAVLTKAPWKCEQTAPLLGQHNQEIYGKRLGYSKSELVELRRAGVI